MKEKIVIITQCAGRKNNRCGFFRIEEQKKVEFVANPELVPIEKKKKDLIFAHPDDIYKNGLTYREILTQYNYSLKDKNPYNLCEALCLYAHPIYKQLKNLSVNKNIPVYILSAGWGLVRGSFLLPHYDITFKAKDATKEKYKIRKYCNKNLNDFNHLKEDWTLLEKHKIYVFVSINYLSLFYDLMKEVDVTKGQVTIFHLSSNIEKIEKFDYKHIHCSQRTNWHYTTLKCFIENGFKIY